MRTHENMQQEPKDLAEVRRRLHVESVRRCRARETPTARQERLRRDRERHQAYRLRRVAATSPSHRLLPSTSSLSSSAAHPSDDASDRVTVQSICGWSACGIPILHLVSLTAQPEVLQRLRAALGLSGLDESVCAVCDSWVLSKNCKSIDIADSTRLDEMRCSLSCDDEDLPPQLINEYDCSSVFPELRGTLLSIHGFHEEGALRVCGDC